MEVAILPRVVDFAPDLVIASAGFDAHHRDPLGNLNLVEADYVWITWRLWRSRRSAAAAVSCQFSKEVMTSEAGAVPSPRM